jgi:hypothetical protein
MCQQRLVRLAGVRWSNERPSLSRVTWHAGAVAAMAWSETAIGLLDVHQKRSARGNGRIRSSGVAKAPCNGVSEVNYGSRPRTRLINSLIRVQNV